MKKQGFTVIEVTATLLVLSMILAIAIPSIYNTVKAGTRNAFNVDVKSVIEAINNKKAKDNTFDPSTINETNIKSVLHLDDSNYKTLTVKEIDGSIYVTIVGQNKWKDLTAAGTANNTSVSNVTVDFVRGANAPVLASGMTPIKWNGSAWVDTIPDDVEWYNYDTANKKWANARTKDGSMWVWIPRYIYKISASNWHTSTMGSINIQFSKGVDDNWNKDVIGNINLAEGAIASNETWTNHPAFTFGDSELTGFWVAKFNVSGTAASPKFIPNVSALLSINTIGEMFTISRNMETNSIYGWGTTGNGIDTHLMKNTERGAVIYLSQSSYGKNGFIWSNNSQEAVTGCSSTSSTKYAHFVYSGCPNPYNTTNGLEASTTGNIYGVYDMGMGAAEYVSAYLDNGNSHLSENGQSIVDANIKYKNVYEVAPLDSIENNYELTINHKGDVIYETSTAEMRFWYTTGESGFFNMSSKDSAFLVRDGQYSFSSQDGEKTQIGFLGPEITYVDFSTFRVTLAVNSNL